MSSLNCEESEVMVRQVNLFHDHISCTKISQQTIGSNICGLQSVADMSQTQTQTHESDHMYATDNKCANHSMINMNNNENTTNSNSNSNGLISNNLFVNNLSDERNQIQKLTEMILAQLDLIQHQQEQLLKKDRQLQGLKQDREALCLRLEKMEKRIAVLTTKVANNQINNNLNLSRNIANSNNSSNNTTETDCDQSGSDTIIEDNNSVIGLFTDPTVFAKLYSQSSGVTTININNLNNNNNSSNTNMNNTNTNTSTNTCITTVRIKSEPQNTIDSEENTATNTTTTSTASARKNRKRHPEVIPTSSTSTTPPNKKRGKGSNVSTNPDINNVDIKKESFSLKETSSDSLRTSQTIKTYSNKKKANKQKSESSANTLNFKTSSLTKDILTTTKPYSLTVNRIHSPLDLCVVNSCSNTDINNTNTLNNNNSSVEEKNRSSTNSDIIQVPNWKLHPVSSCYSLEGTEVLLLSIIFH